MKPKRTSRKRAPKIEQCRNYWLLSASNEAQHCRWLGALEAGIPPISEIAKMTGCSKASLEHVNVFFNNRMCSMFNDRMRSMVIDHRTSSKAFNYRASAIQANREADVKKAPQAIYSDMLRMPQVPASILMLSGYYVQGTALLWEGQFDCDLPDEKPIQSIIEKLGLTNLMRGFPNESR